MTLNIFPKLVDVPFAIACLRSVKYDVQKAVRKLETFCLMSRDFNEYLSWQSEYMAVCYEMMSDGCVVPLKDRDSMGRKDILVDLGKRDPKVYSFADLLRTISTVLTVIVQDDEITSLTGVVLICDGSNLTFQHIPSIKDIQFLVKSSNISVTRIKRMIMYKFPSFMTAPLKIMKSIQSEKMRQRVQIAETIEDIHRIVQPKSMLPTLLNGRQNMEILIKDAQIVWNSRSCRELAEFLKTVQVDWDKAPKKGWLRF